MTDDKPPLSAAMQTLSAAIQNHGAPQAAFCGFDLWLEVMGSGYTSMCNFRAGGQIADGTEEENTLIVPMLVIGGRIVISFDPTLPPDQFYLKP
ncbi:MAG: hypothetical protein AAGJ28_14605 [Pseudomonadota bacterium]